MSGTGVLQGKVAIVTGAGAGIGRAVARHLAASGAHLIINDLDERRAYRTKEAIERTGAEGTVVTGSVVDPQTANALIKTAWDKWSRLDILVNSASVRRNATLGLMPDEWFALVMDVIVKGTFQCIRAATPLMRAAAEQERADGQRVHRKIVNIASTAGIHGAAGGVNYAAATAAVIGITKTLSRELAPFLINCNVIAPGIIGPSRRRNTENVLASEPDEFAQRMPLGRIGTPDDVAGAVSFLVGPDSDESQQFRGSYGKRFRSPQLSRLRHHNFGPAMHLQNRPGDEIDF
jgi:3-oxoacyl-[acyl-carrier protein] reductase